MEVQHTGLVLLQARAETLIKSAGDGLGKTVPTSEKGYQLVAALKSDEEMRSFIFKVAESEARWIRDPGELNGLVPFYSGTQSVQSLESLKKELRAAPWVVAGVGRTAALNEVGYKQVADLKSKPHMTAFARRLLDASAHKSVDEGAFNGLVPYYSGEISVQSFDALKHELLSAPWVAPRDEPERLLGSEPHVSLTQQTFWPFTGSDETKGHNTTSVETTGMEKSNTQDKAGKNSTATKTDTDLKKAIKLASMPAACDDWCVDELFVKVEANATVLKNLSSWGMKCTWAHCASCSGCSDVSTLMATPPNHAAKLTVTVKRDSCDDWCSSETFTALNQNTTSIKQFSWEMKCAWQNCGGCQKCEDSEAAKVEDSLLQEHDEKDTDEQEEKNLVEAVEQAEVANESDDDVDQTEELQDATVDDKEEAEADDDE